MVFNVSQLLLHFSFWSFFLFELHFDVLSILLLNLLNCLFLRFLFLLISLFIKFQLSNSLLNLLNIHLKCHCQFLVACFWINFKHIIHLFQSIIIVFSPFFLLWKINFIKIFIWNRSFIFNLKLSLITTHDVIFLIFVLKLKDDF